MLRGLICTVFNSTHSRVKILLLTVIFRTEFPRGIHVADVDSTWKFRSVPAWSLLWRDRIAYLRDEPFYIWGGGEGLEENGKNKFVATKVRKKVCGKCGRKKIVVEIDEKYVDQKKPQMVTYIIGEAYEKFFFLRKLKKKWLTLIAKKIIIFSRR